MARPGGDTTRRHEGWVGQIEQTARVGMKRLGWRRANRLGRRGSVNRSGFRHRGWVGTTGRVVSSWSDGIIAMNT